MRLLPVLLVAAVLLAAIGSAQDRAKPSPAPSPYAQWKRGLPADPGYFPIAVWLQSPAKAAAYKAAGINLYVALWQGPTAEQLAQLKAAGMPVFVEQTPTALKFIDDPTIVGWMHGDEPDNAQEFVDPTTGTKSYGPCIPPSKVVATRPVEQNGLGMAPPAVFRELARLKSMFELLPETPAIYSSWEILVTRHQVRGKPAHDARLVAAMHAHGLTAILTFDRTGFSKYAGIEVVDPEQVLA